MFRPNGNMRMLLGFLGSVGIYWDFNRIWWDLLRLIWKALGTAFRAYQSLNDKPDFQTETETETFSKISQSLICDLRILKNFLFF